MPQTALITGASSGIGEQLAVLCAADKHDLVLVARNTERLEALAARLREQHGVTVRVQPADLAGPDAPRQLFDMLAREGVRVDVLINNAGCGSNGPFLDLGLSGESAMVAVNVAALVKLTHLFGNPMRERGAGRILNIASTAGFQPGPYMAVYYATKAFVLSFSEALAVELAGTGVTVTCHCPGATDTRFAERAGDRRARRFKQGVVASAEAAARDAYRAMLRGRVVAIHGTVNLMLVESTRLAPRGVVRQLAGRLNRPAY